MRRVSENGSEARSEDKTIGLPKLNHPFLTMHREGPVLKTNVEKRGISLPMHSILVGKYSSHDTQYCDREGPVLMTKVRGMETSAQYCGGEDQY